MLTPMSHIHIQDEIIFMMTQSFSIKGFVDKCHSHSEKYCFPQILGKDISALMQSDEKLPEVNVGILRIILLCSFPYS